MSGRSVVIITVEYGNRGDTLSLVESLEKTEGYEAIELVIVDNSEQDVPFDSKIAEASRRIRIRRLKPPDNLFYWGGANAALSELGHFASDDEPRWVVICNNDVTFSDGSFFTRLATLDPRSGGLIAPCIISAVTGRDQNPFMRKSPGFLTRARWKLYDSGYGMAQLLLSLRPVWLAAAKAFKRSAVGELVAAEIFAPHGACVVVSSDFFRKGGRLDTAVPLFAEELTIATEAARLRVPVTYVPQLRVTHREHTTTGRQLTRFKYELERRARQRFYEMESANA